MKNLFFGLAVVAIALSASAFTNAKSHAKRFATAYITGISSTGNYTFSLSDEDVNCTSDEVRPCEISTEAGYSLPTVAPFEVPVADVNDDTKISIISTQPEF